MASASCLTSAPVAYQSSAIPVIYLILVGGKEVAAVFTISAVA